MIVNRLHIICDGEGCTAGNPFNPKGPAVAILSRWLGARYKGTLEAKGWQVREDPEKGILRHTCPACKRKRK